MLKQKLIIEFDNNIQIEWNIKRQPLAQKWADLVQEMRDQELPTKIMNFHFMLNPKQYYYEFINNSINLLKEKITAIPNFPSLDTITLQDLNSLHDWFANAQDISYNLHALHMSLHSLESEISNPHIQKFPNTHVAWNGSYGKTFVDNEYLLFDKRRNFGDIFLTYHHIGKDPYAIWSSNDILSDDVFVPYTQYSADFVIWFGKDTKVELSEEFWSWFDNNYEWFKQRTNWKPRDTRAGDARYTVATLNTTDLSPAKIKNIIKTESKITNIQIE